jgi:ABC-type transport system involved in cytochrome c biogenesis permease subunit
MLNHTAYLALALYAASFFCYARTLYAPHVWVGRLASLLLLSGIVAHYFALLERSYGTHTIPYDDVFGSMSLFAWLLGVTYLGLELFHRQRSVGAFVSSLLFLWVGVVSALAPSAMPPRPAARGPLFAFHITLDIWAYAAFALSFILSMIYILQDRVLRSHRPGATFWRFPALDVLDRMARSSVYVGLGALTVGVIGGLIWERRLTGAYAWGDPKVIVTLAIVAAYVAYLVLSRTAGWRGARAALVCTLNFAVVLFSYTIVNRYLTTFHRFYK